ncbi:phage/plasmid primase, P4 family [Chloroflexota bacterium]
MQGSGLKIIEGKIGHDTMARYLMDRYTFKTLTDTEEILIYDEKKGYYTSSSLATIKRAVHKILTENGLADLSKRSYINEVTAFIQRSTYRKREKFNSQPHLLNIENGILRIKKGKVIPHTPKFLSTTRIPVIYDEKAKWPNIDRFFSQIVSDEDVPVLIEIFAWCLDLNSPIQRFIILVGDGANGKSTFLSLLRTFMGDNNCSSVTLQSLSHNRFASSELYGKFVNIYPDLPSTLVRDTGLLKALTGGDSISAERKFERGFTFVNTAKLIFSANKPPMIDDESYAIWRRAVIIKFPNRFSGETRDPDLINKLTTSEELSGLLNSAIVKLEILRERGDFSYDPSWKGTRDKYTIMSEPVVAFVESECAMDSLEEVPKPELFKAYRRFCIQAKIPVGTNRAFGRILKRKYKGTIRERQNNWEGITLKQR